MGEYGMITDAGTVRFERILPGPVERVWSYLTESEKRGTWLASGRMELREGGAVELVFRNSELSSHGEETPARYRKYEGAVSAGVVTRCDPQRLLSFTWGEEDGRDSEVTFELTPAADGTVLLVLTHRRLAGRDALLSVAGGWHTHLDVLADRLEEREPAAFWSAHAVVEAEYSRRIPAG
jgi:uncharacterized protein YndB with AHSA1/START domain